MGQAGCAMAGAAPGDHHSGSRHPRIPPQLLVIPAGQAAPGADGEARVVAKIAAGCLYRVRTGSQGSGAGTARLTAEQGGWEVVAPSAIPFQEADPKPRAMDRADLEGILQAFEAATRRALAAGFQVIEIQH